MYTLSTYEPTHSIKYAAPVIALAASADNGLLAVAMGSSNQHATRSSLRRF